MRKPSVYFSQEMNDVILPGFLSSIKNERTAGEYYSCICLVCDYLGKDFLSITMSDAQEYYNSLLMRYHRGELSRRRVNVQLSCYNTFSQFIQTIGEDFTNPFAGLNRAKVDDSIPIMRIPTLEEMDRIMSTAAQSRQNYLIFALAGRAALASSKIVRLTRSNVQELDDKVVLCFDSGEDFGKPDAIIVLPEDVAALMRDYLDNVWISRDDGQHLFYNKRGNPLTIKNLDEMVRNVIDHSEVSNNYTLRDIRSRAILELKRAGASDADVQRYTGLANLRVLTFAKANGIIGDCPADLVNYRLVSKREEES